MNQRLLAIALPLLACLSSCGGKGHTLLQNADGKIRVIHIADAKWKQENARTEMESILERFPQIDLVYAHNDPMAFGAAMACKQKGRTGIRFVGVDGLASEGRKYVADGAIDATFEYPTGAETAIDLALLACSGVEVPKRVVLGTRTYTKANLAAGGEAAPSPGEFVVANLHHQHGDVLTTKPTTDVVFRIGMAQCTDGEPWRVAMREQLIAAAKRYPQVQFDYRAADDDTEKQRGIVRDFITQNYNAILVSPKESLALVAVAKEALGKGIKVIVLDRELGSDDYTAFVGGDNLAIGKAAGTAIGQLLPNGGTIVELQGLMTSSPAQERHNGFVEALGLKKP
ncbi:MAG: substrate-binding domain-containing protein [Planctomycetes bacterium]|nr:substrate-binding domain-containing protein [Planctomycetota bacterium]